MLSQNLQKAMNEPNAAASPSSNKNDDPLVGNLLDDAQSNPLSQLDALDASSNVQKTRLDVLDVSSNFQKARLDALDVLSSRRHRTRFAAFAGQAAALAHAETIAELLGPYT